MPKTLIVYGTSEQIADRVQLLITCILVAFLVLLYVCKPTFPKYPLYERDNYRTACVRG